jgi:hypothetical protein
MRAHKRATRHGAEFRSQLFCKHTSDISIKQSRRSCRKRAVIHIGLSSHGTDWISACAEMTAGKYTSRRLIPHSEVGDLSHKPPHLTSPGGRGIADWIPAPTFVRAGSARERRSVRSREFRERVRLRACQRIRGIWQGDGG